jgi:hypothetical protein
MQAPSVQATKIQELLCTIQAVDKLPDVRIAAIDEFAAALLPEGFASGTPAVDEVTEAWAEAEHSSLDCWAGGDGPARRAFLCENLVAAQILPSLAAVLMDRDHAVMAKGGALLARIGAALG